MPVENQYYIHSQLLHPRDITPRLRRISTADLSIPDTEDWVYAEYEPESYILGHVLTVLLGDDRNYWLYNPTANPGMSFNAEVGRLSKEAILMRLDWERSTPEVPQQIRGILDQLFNTLLPSDLSTLDAYGQARDEWERAVDSIHTMVETDEELAGIMGLYTIMRTRYVDPYLSSSNPQK